MSANVLIVDDNETFLMQASSYLRQHGFSVVTSHSALGVSRLVQQHEPSVIIMDVVMPALDGDEVVRILDRQPQLKPRRVIFYSSLEDEQLAMICSRRPGSTYVSKAAGLPALHRAIVDQLGSPS
jgi:CheY-like chemotaxis protein